MDRNVFSDDYAVDRSDSSGNSSPAGSIGEGSEQLSLSRGHPVQDAASSQPSGADLGQTRSSTSKGGVPVDPFSVPHRAVSTISRADSHRTTSTTSRFSIGRPQSPYRGPTAPSQPYGMYAQNTRAASITSESTIRPSEQPFIPQSSPEHPYSMYPQNTVPEEDDDSTELPLGFPVLGGSSFQGTSSSSSDEVGDIVGSDGHIEQLPPYTRYADNVVAKGDMGPIDGTTVSASDESTSNRAVPPAATGSASDIELRPVGSDSSSEAARKEGLAVDEKPKRRTVFGLSVWTVVIIVAIVVLAAVLGGVIGGVVGNRKGTDAALASGATTTVWLDADPAVTGPNTPSCPTGHYNIPLNQTLEIDTCVIHGALTDAWGCLDFAQLGINVFESPNDPPLSVVFDDYSMRPQLFRYGPQPPDFNGTAFELQPVKDKDDDELGIAMFFSILFDKLIILPPDALDPDDFEKRSVPAQYQRRGWDEDYLNIGEQPWYCYWNSTVSEFWIFLDQDMDKQEDASAASITPAPLSSSAETETEKASATKTATDNATPSGSQTTPYDGEPTTPPPTGTTPEKRQATRGADYFPKLVKMVEKRKPHDNIQPYCQKMEVRSDWQIAPITDVPTICIDEMEYAPLPTGPKMRIVRNPDTTHQLNSNCICEWFSG